MSTLQSSKPIISRVAMSLKFAVLLVLLGLIVVATERPMLFAHAGAVTVTERYVADQANAKSSTGAVAAAGAAATPTTDGLAYFPSQFAAPSGPVEDLPPQF